MTTTRTADALDADAERTIEPMRDERARIEHKLSDYLTADEQIAAINGDEDATASPTAVRDAERA